MAEAHHNLRALLFVYTSLCFPFAQVDDGPQAACWPVLDHNAPLPRLSGLSPGTHTLRACVTDPTGAWALPSSWSEVRTFIVGGAVVADASSGGADDTGGEDAQNEGDAPIRMDPPLIFVRSPPEMSVITTNFVDLAYEVGASDPVVLELDENHSFQIMFLKHVFRYFVFFLLL